MLPPINEDEYLMVKVVNLDDYKPHIAIQVKNGNVHVIPRELFQNIIIGKTKISEVEKYEDIFVQILDEWMKYKDL